MDFAAWFSMKEGLLSPVEYDKIHTHLKGLACTVHLPNFNSDSCTAILESDKKNTSQGLLFIALEKIGCVRMLKNVPIAKIVSYLAEYIKEEDALIRG